MMNFYKILNISPNSSAREITSAYRKLAKKYHPDKNNNSHESIIKFRNIQNAYEVLRDPDKRKKYDNLNSHQQDELFDILNNYMTSNFPYKNIYESFVSFIYPDKNEFRSDVNKCNVTRIVEKIFSGVSNFIRNPDLNNKSLQDYDVPEKLDEESSYLIKQISLYEYLYGGCIYIHSKKNKSIMIKFDGFVDQLPLIKLNKLDASYITPDIKKSGDIYIFFQIKNISNPFTKNIIRSI